MQGGCGHTCTYLFVGVAVRVDVVIKFRVLCVLLVAEFTVKVLPHLRNHVFMHLLPLGCLLGREGEGEVYVGIG